MTPNKAQPWRALPTMRPKVKVSAAPIRNSIHMVRRLVSAFGFS